MPVSKDDFSAFDEAVKAAKTTKATSSRTEEDDFSAFDEAVKKKRKPSDIESTKPTPTSKEPQATESKLKSTIPTPSAEAPVI